MTCPHTCTHPPCRAPASLKASSTAQRLRREGSFSTNTRLPRTSSELGSRCAPSPHDTHACVPRPTHAPHARTSHCILRQRFACAVAHALTVAGLTPSACTLHAHHAHTLGHARRGAYAPTPLSPEGDEGRFVPLPPAWARGTAPQHVGGRPYVHTCTLDHPRPPASR